MKDQIKELNYQFKEQIRRRKIDDLFSKRRKEMLAEFNGDATIQASDITANQQLLSQIRREIEENSNSLNLQILKAMAKLSIDQNTIKGINNQTIINSLIEYLDEKYLQSPHQYYATFVLCNIFCVNNNNTVPSDEFLQNLFVAAINSNVKARENCMVILFHIIHDSPQSFLNLMIQKPSLNIVNLFYHQLKSDPPVSIVQETMRCYYILIKKLGFPKLQCLAKVRQFIFFVIKSSNNFQLTYMATMCLSGMLQCLPDQRDLSKTGILKILTEKVQASKNENLALLVLGICQYCATKSPESEIKNVIFPFLFELAKTFDNHTISVKVYSFICNLVFNHKAYIGFIIQNNFSIFQKMLWILENSTDYEVATEVSNCICLFLLHVSYIPEEVRLRAQDILKKILQKNELSQGSLEFIQQMLDCTMLN